MKKLILLSFLIILYTSAGAQSINGVVLFNNSIPATGTNVFALQDEYVDTDDKNSKYALYNMYQIVKRYHINALNATTKKERRIWDEKLEKYGMTESAYDTLNKDMIQASYRLQINAHAKKTKVNSDGNYHMRLEPGKHFVLFENNMNYYGDWVIISDSSTDFSYSFN